MLQLLPVVVWALAGVNRESFFGTSEQGQASANSAAAPSSQCLPLLFVFPWLAVKLVVQSITGKMEQDQAALSRAELYSRFETVLGVGTRYKVHHLSTRPTKSDALFAAAPATRPQRTFCESHFLTLAVTSTSTNSSTSDNADRQAGHVFVFAVEILVYTTATLTTLFVSKADSTGHLPTSPTQQRQSPIRPLTSTFITWLAETRQRPGIPLVVSLFARAQDQYLFPGSVDHGAKHVLDDRQLVKWWCKTLDPVLRLHTDDSYTTRAHVIVPGFDSHETTQFFPNSYRSDPPDNRKWRHGHPLLAIAPNPSAPPRCLVPHFPDDPKARYLDELDAELPDSQPSQSFFSPSKKGNGMWKSIRTLDQFWDTMAFRQECSSGRMVGFIWLVFTPTQPTLQSLEDSITNLTTATSFNADDLLGADTIFSSQESIGQASQTTKSSPRKSSRRKKLSGPIIPRQLKSSSSNLSSRSDKSSSKEWPEKGRGQIVLDHSSYNRVHDLLLRLDFSDLNAATSSTRKWLGEVTAITAPAADWGKEINGAYQVGNQTAVAGQAATPTSGQVNDLSGMLIRKKRKNAGDEAQPPAAVDTPAINVLGAAMIRKKPKVSNS
jgi:regulator of Ty1 transposition protein 109